MGCLIEFIDSMLKFEFCGEGAKQKIMLDILLNHGNMDIRELADSLETTPQRLQKIQSGSHFFDGEQANDLAQIFLTFFGKTFFRKFTLVRNFTRPVIH